MSGKVAIVTGAARGIGLATTRLLRDEGWSVAMVDRDSEALHRAAEGAGVFPVECDVSDPAQVSTWPFTHPRSFRPIVMRFH